MGPLAISEYKELFDAAESIVAAQQTLLNQIKDHTSLVTIAQYFSTTNPPKAVDFVERALVITHNVKVDQKSIIEILIFILENLPIETRYNKLLAIRDHLSTDNLVCLAKSYLHDPKFAANLACIVLKSTNKEGVDWYCSTFVPYMSDQELNDLISSDIHYFVFVNVAQSLFEHVGEEFSLKLVQKRISSKEPLLDSDALWIAHAFDYLPEKEWKHIIVSIQPLLGAISLYEISE